jgi:[calcium/calmodulin-dependent protein kinase] kinase
MMSANGVVKIVDFGVSEMFSKQNGGSLTKTAGSPAFYAPETTGCIYFIHLVHKHGLPAMAGDVWAMGVTLYCLLFGTLPFKGKTILELFESIREHQQQYPPGTDPSLVRLLDALLQKDPEQRISIPELRVSNGSCRKTNGY